MAISLVTGGAGFIGSHLVERLVARGDTVRVLDNLRMGKLENIASVASQVEFFQGDVSDEALVNRAIKGVDFVFHHAALTSVPLSVREPLETDEQNIRGTLHMLEASRKAGTVKRFIYPGSTSAYGPNAEGASAESARPEPVSPYAVQKVAGEHYTLAYHFCHGLPTTVLRYFNIYGERQDPAGTYAAAIPHFVQMVLKGERPTIFGDGLQTRDFCHVANVVDANLLAIERPEAIGGLFNVATGEGITVLDVITMISELCGVEVDPLFQPIRSGDVKHSLADIALARENLDYRVNVDLREGLRRTIEWFRCFLSV